MLRTTQSFTLGGLLCGLFIGLMQSTVAAEELAAFVPVDTSTLIEPPDPLALEKVVAFPHLKFDRPIELTHAHDETDRIFVAEQKGVIRVFKNSPDTKQSSVFLDLQKAVSREGNEEGLLGLAFHPDYSENGEFYLYYSVAKPRRMSVISRFHVSQNDANKADPKSEQRLMEIPQPFGNHNGGSLKFGKDGYLYIGLGDGGLANDPYGNGQDLSSLLGSILRLNVNAKEAPLGYAIPDDNPFVNRPGARGEIYAYGFRNPWRLSVDRKTGAVWCGDVGQERYEEVNLVIKGGNYGWKVREGKHAFEKTAEKKGEKLTEPVAEYFHSEGVSVTGGLVYRGDQLPEYNGHYFFGDYVSGNVWSVVQKTVPANVSSWKMKKVADTKLKIAAFGEDQQGEMYLCTFDGKIYQLKKREIDFVAAKKAFPKTLSETGLFASVKDHKVARGVLPYEVNVPFWSDNAEKERFIALPKKGSVVFHEKEKWEFPLGTVFIKTFRLPLDQRDAENPGNYKRLETRLFVHGNAGWAGYTYKWNDGQTEATLLEEGELNETLAIQTADGRATQTWHYPSRVDCMACHSKAQKFVLGWNTRQLNREEDYTGHLSKIGKANQIETYAKLGLFQNKKPEQIENLEAYLPLRTHKPQDPTAMTPDELSEHSRAWLEVNCAMCHHPDGIAGKVGGQKIDFRYHLPLNETGILNRKPGQGQLSPPGSAVLAPGNPSHSELLWRVRNRADRKMPPLATLREDNEAIEILHAWLISLSKSKEQK